EKHFESPNFNTDFRWLKKKVEMGAEFIVTQMFFNVEKYKEFVNTCREHDIHVPIIPGLKPLTTKKQLITLPRSEEHTSELQSRENLVCRLLLEKKKIKS